MKRIPVLWVTHPRHLPKPPGQRFVVVDVAFAAGKQARTVTGAFITDAGDRLARWVDHHEHKEAWPLFAEDPRFLLVPNRDAHACPELITPELVAQTGDVELILAHCDFDGLVAAAKWRAGGEEPWTGADEDARAIDSPGRGHSLTPKGERLAMAIDQASAECSRKERIGVMNQVLGAIFDGEESLEVETYLDELAKKATEAERKARARAEALGSFEGEGVFVVRTDSKNENRERRNLLIYAEEQAPIGCLFEPDPGGGAWVYAATFDPTIDLEDVPHFKGGRSDFRFAKTKGDGSEHVAALAQYLAERAL